MIEPTTDLDTCLRIRREVFIVGQNVPEDLEIDEHDADPETIHLLAFVGGRALGTARMRQVGEAWKVERVAVLDHARGTGVGRGLMMRAEEIASGRKIVLSSQLTALGFYRRLGYTEVGGEDYLDAGIWHRDMEKVPRP
ncbi:MAG: GNAT family N-acetyltransferase [Flaviflexus sp.]|nr:GNAT family N-acetyltransferase [Flaviflexus sp.]